MVVSAAMASVGRTVTLHRRLRRFYLFPREGPSREWQSDLVSHPWGEKDLSAGREAACRTRLFGGVRERERKESSVTSRQQQTAIEPSETCLQPAELFQPAGSPYLMPR